MKRITGIRCPPVGKPCRSIVPVCLMPGRFCRVV